MYLRCPQWSLLVVVLLDLIPWSLGRTGFIKDQTIDVEFPARLTRSGDGIPMGHLRPLGWQRNPEGKVPEENQMLEPHEFYNKYAYNKSPVVFRNAVKGVPAMSKWKKDEYLKENYGEIPIHAVVKKERLKMGPQKMKFRKFLREYQYEDWYLSNIVPQEMMHELALPQCLACGMRKYLQESELWMSSGDTASLIHSHSDQNMHCLLAGRKDFILINPKYQEKLVWKPRNEHPGAGYSNVDVDRVNMFKHKSIQEAPWTWTTLKPGDCIFVPAGYPHQVRSWGRSISSTMHWSASPDTDVESCKDEPLDRITPLSEATFVWTYVGADKQLTNSQLNAPSLRHHLLVLMRDEILLRYELFAAFYEEVMSEVDDEDAVDKVWNLMDMNKIKIITRQEIKEMDDSILEKVAAALNKASKPVKHDEL